MKNAIKNPETSVEWKQWKTYCDSCKKYTENESSNVRKNKQNRLMLLLNCAACGKNEPTFIKNKELHNSD